MDIYNEELEYGPEHIPVFQKVVDMFEGKPDFQRIVRLGILANMGYNVEYDETGSESYDLDTWVRNGNRSDVHAYSLGGNRVSSSSPQPRPQYYATSSADAGNLGASKGDDKAEKKRLKRQKRKERKRMEKEKQNMDKKEEKDENRPDNAKSKPDVKEQAAAKDSDVPSSESEDYFSEEDLSDCEELDMSSIFVSKARSKLEQKPKPEKEKKIPAKEPKASPEKPNRDAEAEKASASAGSHSVEDNIKISTQLATLGNTYANTRDYKTAVQCYTDAIKHNPREYKLFGNRSFCFEKMRLYMKALDDAELSLSMCPGWVKGLFRKGRALAGLKRYEEAERAFREVLEVDSSFADATQELRRVQIAQLMVYGYTLDQSVQALHTHKSVKKALHFLTHSIHQPANQSSGPHLHRSPSPKASPSSHQHPELYPIWVGNLFCPVTESSLEQLFNKVGPVRSVKLLSNKRCAFVNFTNQEDCERAIRRFHGFDFNGTKIAVRYPDRIPLGIGISRSALTSDDLPENYRGRDAAGSRRDAPPYRSTNY